MASGNAVAPVWRRWALLRLYCGARGAAAPVALWWVFLQSFGWGSATTGSRRMLLAPHLLVSVLLGQLDFGAVMDMQTLTEANRWPSPPLFQSHTMNSTDGGADIIGSAVLAPLRYGAESARVGAAATSWRRATPSLLSNE
eukprot:COSAG02_NODE_21904_length_770_cov_4.694486_1_plen_141_part_00